MWNWLWIWVIDRGWKNFEAYDRKNTQIALQRLRNMVVRGDSGEMSEQSKEQVMGNWKKDDPCQKLVWIVF